MTSHVADDIGWRAVTVEQPWCWALTHASQDLINRTQAVPAKVLHRDCSKCGGNGIVENRWCHHCVRDGDEPLMVMVHSAASRWDRDLKMDTASHNFLRSLLPDDSSITLSYDRASVTGFINNEGTGISQPMGAVVAVARVVGSHEAFDARTPAPGMDPEACCESIWARFPHDGSRLHHWQVTDVRPLDVPIPARGNPGLWVPDTELANAVEAQLASQVSRVTSR